MWSLQSPRLKRETCSQTPFSRQVLFLTPHQWSLPDLLHVICRFSSHTSRPRHHHLSPDDNVLLALQPKEALLGSHLGPRHHSVPLPLSDSSLAGRVMHASIRSLPEPLRNEGVFGNRSLVPPPGGRRLPSQLLVGLEGSGGGRLGSGGTAGWLSDPLRPSTSSFRASAIPAGVLPSVHQGSRLNLGASKPSSEGGSRASPTVSGFLQPSIPRPGGFGVVAPHHRSVDPERIHHLVTLPHGDSSVSPEFHPPRRLDDLPGPAGRIPSGSGASRFASLPSLRGSRKDLPVQGPLFRSYNRASSLHEDYGPSVRHPPQVRGQDASLPGRLAHPGLYRNRLHSVKGQAPISLQRTRHPGQLQEVVSSSHLVSSVLRHGDSISAFYCSSPTSTSQQSRSPYRGVLINPVSSGVPLASPPRPPVFSDSSRLWRDDQDEASSALPQRPVGLPGRSVPGLPVPSLSRGPSLVVESGSAERGSESLSSSSGHQLLLGRFGCRLGSPRRRTPRLGPLAPPSEGSLYQHERASSSSARPAGLRTPACGHVGSSVLRQHHHSSLPSSFGRDVFFHSERHSKGDSPLGGELPHSSSAPVHHVTADALSRPNQVIGSEWTLHQEVVDQLVHKWPAVIDLFATSLTARLPVYFSPASDPRAAGTDALLQSWDDLQAYAFPPIAIIRRVLLKLRSSKNCELTLIAPFWPQRDWFPDLLELLSDVPVTLSGRRDLLRQPHFHRFHLNLPMLQLTAWRLSSDSPSRPASLLRWLDSLSSVEDCPRA